MEANRVKMVACRIFFSTPRKPMRLRGVARSEIFRGVENGNHPMVACAPVYRGERYLMSRPARSQDSPSPTRPMSVKQELALKLVESGMSQTEIAHRLGVRHRQAVGRLIARAKQARAADRRRLERILEGQSV
jgi:hypothetical protein